MKLRSMILAFVFSAATPALAVSYDCGIFVGSNEEPSAKFKFDGVNQAYSSAEGFIGVAQVEKGQYIVATASDDNTVAAALYQPNTSVLLSFLQLPSEKYAATACVLEGQKLVRPTVNLRF